MNHPTDDELLRKNLQPRYEYETMQIAQVVGLTMFCDKKDSYRANDEYAIELRRMLSLGFRWIRTDGEYAVFERTTWAAPDLYGDEFGVELEKRNHPDVDRLLGMLKQEDSNGWCIATDGTFDDLSNREVIDSLTRTLETIHANNTEG